MEAVHPRVERRVLLGGEPTLRASPRRGTLPNQLGAVLVQRTGDEGRRRLIMAATVAVDLGVLGLFKYYGFFAGEIGSFLDSLGLGMLGKGGEAAPYRTIIGS
jgi:hypothetical protein